MRENRLVMRRFTLVFLFPVCLAFAEDRDSIIDEAIPLTGESLRPVFVRMEDQLFRKAGDHEAFCKKHADLPRSQNRKEVTAVLQ